MSVSPSQIETWRSCKRKWAFVYLSGLPRPPETKAQKIGIALHAKAETFISTGHIDYSSQTPEETEAARLLPAILDYLPEDVPSEQKVKATIDGVDFGGRFDWYDPIFNEIGDLKTTSSLRWAKTEQELAVHPQPLIYAAAIGGDITCRWVYVQTKGAPHVREVKFRPDFSAMPGIVKDAKDIVRAWTDKGDPNTYEPNLGACDAYGGCPYRSQCRVDSGKRLAMLMGLTRPQSGPNPKDPPDMTTSFDDLMAAIQKPAAPAAQTNAINPPPMQAVTRTEELPAVLDPAKAPVSEEQERPSELGVLGAVLPREVNDALKAATKRKRRTKAEMAAAKIVPGTFADLAEVAAIVGTVACDPQPKTDPAPAQDDDKPIGTLYVGCQPDHAFENGAYVFNAANWEVCEPAGLSDYRQADFNKLQGFFVAAVVGKIRDIRPEHLFVDTRWAETNACLASLIALSGKVVRSL